MKPFLFSFGFWMLFAIGTVRAQTVEIPFEATDIDGGIVVGTPVAIDPEKAILRADAEQKEIDVGRLETLRNLRKNPFLSYESPSRRTSVAPPGTPGLHGAAPNSRRPVPRFGPAEKEEKEDRSPFPDSVIVLDMLDGTRFVATSLTAKGETAHCRLLRDHPSEQPETTIPFPQIISIRFDVKRHDEIAAPPESWRKLVASADRKGDRLVVGQPDSLDLYDGIVLEIGPQTVSFSVEGETLPVPRRRVYGVLLHASASQTDKSSTESFSGNLSLWNGAEFHLKSLKLQEGKDLLDWTTVSGISGTVSLAEVDAIRFGRKNVLFLSDLTPLVREQSLRFDWEKQADGRDSPLGMLRDFQANRMSAGAREESNAVSIFDVLPARPLPGGSGKSEFFKRPVSSPEGIRLDGVFHRHGLILSAKATVVFSVPGSYSALRGVAGFDDRIRPNGRARLVIRAGEDLLCDLLLRGDEPATTLKYDLPENAGTISVTVDFPETFTETTTLCIGDLKLIQ